MKRKIAAKLKQLRGSLELSTEDVSTALKQYGLDISPNTLYNYENGVSQPKADMFLCLCKIYQVENFDIFFDESDAERDTVNQPNALTTAYEKLNDKGRERLQAYAEAMTDNPKYVATGTKTKITEDVIDEFLQAPTPTLISTK